MSGTSPKELPKRMYFIRKENYPEREICNKEKACKQINVMKSKKKKKSATIKPKSNMRSMGD